LNYKRVEQSELPGKRFVDGHISIKWVIKLWLVTIGVLGTAARHNSLAWNQTDCPARRHHCTRIRGSENAEMPGCAGGEDFLSGWDQAGLSAAHAAVDDLMRIHPHSGQASSKLILALLACLILSTFLVHRYVFAIYIIEGSSMAPTLKHGDTALVNMGVWRLRQLERSEIVLVRDGKYQEYATKRIVGLPGEKIEFRSNRVYVQGQVLVEPYLAKDTLTVSSRSNWTLGPDEYFVLGDNRADSFDSRSYGPVTKAAIRGSYGRTFWACR
jgi:signal peptidase I